ncbi:transcription termination/antitermination NusG family protein [Salipiger sp. H15]|uniref:Transcription termination/antitermination NusG family protein n=1 Tax=Alloyangia sp. H15 TaxID=3029062 RepID=A0AAU8ALY8_9RHOB
MSIFMSEQQWSAHAMVSPYLSLRVGDAVPIESSSAPIFEPGESAWYALLCRPQQERQAESWLAARDVYAFHPVTSRQTRVRGRVREYERRYLPGYIFARFNGVPLPHRVLTSPFLTGALCRSDGRWGVLGPKRLAALHEMRARDLRQEDELRAAKRKAAAARRVLVGDRAMFRAGPFEGFHCEVVEIDAVGGLKVRFELFGRENSVVTSPDSLVSLAEKES